MTDLQKVIREWRMDARIEGIKEGEERARSSVIIKILTKKLSEQVPEEILELINNASIEGIEKVEDKIFEITSWSDVRELICN